jgi:two-component system sensor histidine kinase MprB
LVDSLVALAGVMDDQEPPAVVGAGELVQAAIRRLPASVAGRIIVVGPDAGRAADAGGAGDAMLWVRPAQVQRALVNLLTNAAKFDSDSEGSAPASIEVRVTTGVIGPSSVIGTSIAVRDHGPGIAPADLPHVFDRFYRADTAQLVQGSGLGLSIVADICRHNHGTVGVINHPDGGVVATVAFPQTAS